jgi:uncharacterized protein (TIGR03083 family)
MCPIAWCAPRSNGGLRIHPSRTDDRTVDGLVERHRRACDGFSRIAHAVPSESWTAATPCTEWTARDVVEHVIGFHDFLLLRPLGVRAQRPRENSAARWDATADALFAVLAVEGELDRETELPGGGTGSARTTLEALTTDVLIHTWDMGLVDDESRGLVVVARLATDWGVSRSNVSGKVVWAEFALAS